MGRFGGLVEWVSARLAGWIAAEVESWRRRRLRARTLGQRGERVAEHFLRRRGMRIVDRSARGGLGEIDLVAIDQRTIVFVEVKTRRTVRRGDPADAVDLAKQRRLTRLALAWLKRHELLENSARFDVVAITWPHEDQPPEIRHFPNAFEAVGRGQFFA